MSPDAAAGDCVIGVTLQPWSLRKGLRCPSLLYVVPTTSIFLSSPGPSKRSYSFNAEFIRRDKRETNDDRFALVPRIQTETRRNYGNFDGASRRKGYDGFHLQVVAYLHSISRRVEKKRREKHTGEENTDIKNGDSTIRKPVSIRRRSRLARAYSSETWRNKNRIIL